MQGHWLVSSTRTFCPELRLHIHQVVGAMVDPVHRFGAMTFGDTGTDRPLWNDPARLRAAQNTGRRGLQRRARSGDIALPQFLPRSSSPFGHRAQRASPMYESAVSL